MLKITDEQKDKYFKKRLKGGVVYKITNTDNGDFYIGSTQNLYKRYYTHINDIRKNKKTCTLLIRAVNKYGEDRFSFEIIEECGTFEVVEREQHYIDILNPKYNILKTAYSSIGAKRSDETKKAKSECQKEKWKDESYRSLHLSHLSKNWKSGESHHMSKISVQDVIEIKNKLKEGLSHKEISEILNVSIHSVKDIGRGKTWKSVLI